MHRDDFSTLMDQVIVRENLPGNSAAEPKKTVQIMISADFEDSSVPQEKVSHLFVVEGDVYDENACGDRHHTDANQKHSNNPVFHSSISKHLFATFCIF